MDGEAVLVVNRGPSIASAVIPVAPSDCATDQVVGRGAEGEHPIDEASTAMPQFAQEGHGSQPAEDLLHELALGRRQTSPGLFCGLKSSMPQPWVHNFPPCHITG